MAKKKKAVIVDTNLVKRFLKGTTEEARKIQAEMKKIGNENIGFSIITHAEFYAICKKKTEFKPAQDFFNRYTCYGLDEISPKFRELTINYRREKWIPDALIAATALYHGLELYTENRRDFEFIEGLELYNPSYLSES